MKEENIESVQLRRLAETEIGSHLSERLRGLLQSCFADYPDRTYFKLPPHYRYLAEMNGEIEAQMGVEFRMIRNSEHVLRILGVVDLCVMPTNRSRGLATTLLDEVTRFGQQCEVEFIVLFADDDRLYTRNGWTRVDNRCSWTRIKDHRTLGLAENEDSGAMMVKSLTDRTWPSGEVDLLGHLF
jgi:hypothetical protein